jgi:hypothetical protein
VRQQGGYGAPGLRLRPSDQALGEVGPAAAQRSVGLSITGRRTCGQDAVAGGAQHAQRVPRDVRLEVAAEAVREQHELGAACITVDRRY